MLRYILRRMLLAMPTLLVISFLAFGMGKCAPGDPVQNVFGEEIYASLDPAQQAARYQAKAKMLGLGLPDFYVTITTAAYPDTLSRIFPPDRRGRLENLVGQTGNWSAVQTYEAAVSRTVRAVEALPQTYPQATQLRLELTNLINEDRLSALEAPVARLHALEQVASATPAVDINPHTAQALALQTALGHLDSALFVLRTKPTLHKLRTPAVYWHGTQNQYYRWLSGFLTGNLGLTKDGKEVWEELWPSLVCTLAINGIAMCLAYLIAVPLGVEMARRKGKRMDRWSKRILVFIYSMPVFWTGGLLILLFTTTHWGKALIPSVYFDIRGAWIPGSTTFSQWWSANVSKCILPILILTLYAVGVLALQMRSGMLGTLHQDYIRTARAKGVQAEELYWSHALRNALFPIITIFASLLPAIFAGSLVIETLFLFPGVGSKTFDAYRNQDLPMLSAIMMIAATLAVVGSLLADLMYAWADPRVRFSNK